MFTLAYIGTYIRAGQGKLVSRSVMISWSWTLPEPSLASQYTFHKEEGFGCGAAKELSLRNAITCSEHT